jgi:hypothetical protein
MRVHKCLAVVVLGALGGIVAVAVLTACAEPVTPYINYHLSVIVVSIATPLSPIVGGFVA